MILSGPQTWRWAAAVPAAIPSLQPDLRPRASLRVQGVHAANAKATSRASYGLSEETKRNGQQFISTLEGYPRMTAMFLLAVLFTVLAVSAIFWEPEEERDDRWR